MEIILGKPQIRGNSDVIFNYGAASAIAAGAAVKRTGEKEIAVFDGSGIPFGVSGYADNKNTPNKVAVIEAGKSVGVLLDDANEAISVGAQVYITAGGKFTAVATDNTPTAAVFVEKGDALNLATGEKIANGAALIDMVGGF
ncbi:MAG: hypothetical protein LBH29_03095 [Elusimicrobiota bacterium]|jgi:hypothetical protein|nr:hypothetical protein [Elusimicrobiota bacterium]